MAPDTFPREKLALAHRHTFAAWARVTNQTWILACLAQPGTFAGHYREPVGRQTCSPGREPWEPAITINSGTP